MFTRRCATMLTLLLFAFQAPAAANPMGQTENFVDRPGGDYHRYSAGGYGQCAKSCATDSRCMAYTYVLSTGICWMKDVVPRRRSNNCCVSGVKRMSAQEINVDRPGSDIRRGYPVVTSSQCESACSNSRDCLAYTYVKPDVQAETGLCWLKNGTPRRVPNPCCISGVKLRAQ